MVFQGLKFGLLLQLAVGPVCLMVFNTASSMGIIAGLTMTWAVTLVDALYIALAGCGLVRILHNQQVKAVLRVGGCIVLLLFGFNNIAGAFSYSILPVIKLFANNAQHGVFWQGLLLTLSNPLTIIFWGGIFSAQVLERELNQRQLVLFALGCILSTLIFIGFIAVLGSMVHEFFSKELINILNIGVGIMVICFGLKLLKHKG